MTDNEQVLRAIREELRQNTVLIALGMVMQHAQVDLRTALSSLRTASAASDRSMNDLATGLVSGVWPLSDISPGS